MIKKKSQNDKKVEAEKKTNNEKKIKGTRDFFF